MTTARSTSRWLRWWPRSIAGQLIFLMVLALIAAQITFLVVMFDERRASLRLVHREQVIERSAAVLRLLQETPAALQQRVLATASSPGLEFSLDDDAEVEATSPDKRARFLAEALMDRARGATDRVRVEIEEKERPSLKRLLKHWFDDDGGHREHDRKGWRKKLLDLTLSARMADGQIADGKWLNIETGVPPRPPIVGSLLLSWAFAAMAIALVVIVAVRRITRPLRHLADAADLLGRGQAGPPIPEAGPEEVRRATAAFNRMRDRLDRFIADRTRMLGAISHDLRTPITSLRLRAEFIEDPATREKMLETLEEMQRMTEAALAFAREESTREGAKTVELSALLDSLCADLKDMGQDVTMAEAERTPIACRPVSLKRALRNLIENAVTYGGAARVALEQSPDQVTVTIDDDGPGIPAGDLERIFEPFVRLEESRNQETGGVGLGLSIARSIARAHGGDVTLENRREGGLRARLFLPKAPDRR